MSIDSFNPPSVNYVVVGSEDNGSIFHEDCQSYILGPGEALVSLDHVLSVMDSHICELRVGADR